LGSAISGLGFAGVARLLGSRLRLGLGLTLVGRRLLRLPLRSLLINLGLRSLLVSIGSRLLRRGFVLRLLLPRLLVLRLLPLGRLLRGWRG